MPFRLLAWSATFLLLVLACGGNEVLDTAPVDTDPPEQEEQSGGCDEVTLKIQGSEAPVVGDCWTVWLYCDDALLTGASVLSFDPPDFAAIDGNTATFLYAGTAVMKMQVGAYWEEQEVTVASADTGAD